MSLVGPTIPITTPKPLTAQKNIQYLAVPGHYASSDVAAYLSRATNTVASTRVKVLACNSWIDTDISGVPSAADQQYLAFRTGATTRVVRCTMVLQPLGVHDTANSSSLTWRLVPTGGGSTLTQDAIRIETVETGTIKPGSYIRVDQDWTDLAPNTEYQAILSRTRYARWVSYSIYEKQLTTSPLTGTIIAGTDPAQSVVGGEIKAQQIEDIWTSQKNVWRLNGASISQSKLDSTTYTTTSATYVNMYDNSLTAYDANGPGHYFFGEYKNPQGGTATTEVPVRAWVYGLNSGGGSGSFSWEGSGGSEIVVTINSGTPAVFYTDGTITASNQKLDPMIKTTAGTLTVIGWGLYEYEA